VSYRVVKKTGTYADTLLAVGLAHLLGELGGGAVTISDAGEEFGLRPGYELPPPEEWPPLSPGYPYIWEKSKERERPPGNVIDYEHIKEEEKLRREHEKRLGKAKAKVGAGLAEAGLGAPSEPHPELRMATIMASMRKGFDSDRQLFRAVWEHQDELARVVARRLPAFTAATPPPAAPEPTSDEEPFSFVSVSQLFNPAFGKGVNRLKPTGTTPGSYPPRMRDWFEEWLKFRGAFVALLPYRSGDDFRIYAIEPGDIDFGTLQELRRELLRQNMWGTVKLDIAALHNLARLLVIHSKDYDSERGRFRLRRRPSEVIKGLHLAFFKSLGTAAALMNSSFLGLPGWFEIRDRASAEAFLDVIEEHRRCLRSLAEDNSGDVPVLLAYREFLSSGSLEMLLDFLAQFAVHVMQSRERKERYRWASQFTTTNLWRLFTMTYQLSAIVEDEGFLNLATAIRKATVSAQFRKAITGKQPWDIHYGLAQEWKRKTKFEKELIAGICDFVWKYNNENARHAEQGKERRKSVSTEDLGRVIKLIENKGYGPELVGMLLLAYGYAREPKEDEAAPADTQVQTEGGN